MKTHFLALLLFQLILNIGSAQDITGTWHGIVNFPGDTLRVDIHVKTTDSSYSGTLDIPDNGILGIPISVSVSGDAFGFKAGAANYKGILSRKSQTIEGILKHVTLGSFNLRFSRDSIAPPPRSIVTIKKDYSKEELQIEMRDGVKLFTSVYSPRDKSDSYPILIIRTPYNIEPSETAYNSRLRNLSHLLKEKYILVFQDVRGRYMSEGEFVHIRPYNPNKKDREIDENSDTYDTVDWLVKNVENNNGAVGIFGISYPGFYSTMALPDAHPAIKAVSPQAPVSDWFIGDDFHHNGAFFLMDAFSFLSSVGRPRPKPTRAFPAPFDFENEDNYDFYKDIGPVKNVQEKFFGDSIQFWPEFTAHPNYDDFWKARNVLPHLKKINPAVLVVGGWFDAEDLYGPLKTYAAIETQNDNVQNRLVMGPWYHGQWTFGLGEKLGNIHFGSNTSNHFKNLELQFFNYYLKNIGKMDIPEASIFITGSNEWKAFERWPPKNVENKDLYLQCDEKLSFDKPTDKMCFDEYVVDPNKPVPYTEDVHLRRTREYLTDDQRFASRRPDVMVFQTDILEEDITIVGSLKVNFHVSTTGTDADYVVKIIDVFPDQLKDYPTNEMNVPMGGYQMLVRGEVLRGKYRNSFEKPEPFKPNEVTEVSFEIPDTAHKFKKGHRIMIQVQNSWFPLVDINPQSFVNIYTADEKDFIKATHRIYHDASRSSKISISILKN